ncbi:MAG: DinB family protein [Bacteroidia bacterium]|nr:DinB family protein [Bacteroidia bacterium]
MKYNLEEAIQFLERTPLLLSLQLKDLPIKWTNSNEGPETWSAFDVLGHLIHGENTDWVARIEIILSDSEKKTFEPFDRFAQMQESVGKTMNQLLEEFIVSRRKNLAYLRSKNITENDLGKVGIHPKFGSVTLRNLLATWVAHDLNHLSQINRVLANQYKEEVGPWSEYLRIINK